MHTVESLACSPNSLAIHYDTFQVSRRLLLTGHSHQAWPDCAGRAQMDALHDAARLVDDKWAEAFGKADQVRAGYRRLLGDSTGHVALGPSTHDLLVKLLSALDLRRKPRIVTSDGEFHSMRRQLDRLSEEAIEIVRVPARPVESLADRLAAAMLLAPARTASVMVSSVLFATAEIVPGLQDLARACDRAGVPLVIDAYHHLNVVPMRLDDGLGSVFVLGGGYKYCQLGEGNAFLRIPPDCELRPLVTGWFSEFGLIGQAGSGHAVEYGAGAARFAGATYDPVSHYRAAAVFSFFHDQGLTVELLREVSQHQVGLLRERFDDLDLDERVILRDRSVELSSTAGFLALQSPHAARITAALRRRGVWADYRGDLLRLGPAPYLSDAQLCEAVDRLGQAVREDLVG